MAALTVAIALTVFAIGDDGAPLEAPEPVAAPPVADQAADETPPPEPAYTVWDRLAWCESSGRWFINSGNGYYGGLQQDLVFWRRHGGLAYASRPDLADRDAQIAVATVGQRVQGWGAWPVCSRRLGLR